MDPPTSTTGFEDTLDTASENEEVINSRWWEAGAQRTLESTSSIKDIQLICRYVPFNNPHAISLALSKQRRPQLNTLYISAHFKYNKKGNLYKCSPCQIAESIITLVLEGQEISTLPRTRRYWTPPNPASPVSVEEIAGSLEEHFCRLICHVCLKDWITAALGYNTTAITSLLKECLDTRTALYQWYKQKRLPTSTWESVEEILRSQNPLAHWTASNDMAHPNEALRSLFRCFHTLSAEQAGDFMCWVRQLAVLAERFQQNIRSSHVNWDKNLLSGSTLLHQISCEDLGVLARELKEEDASYFRALNRNDFFYESSGLSDLGVRWQNLSENARACAIADIDMGAAIGELAKVLARLDLEEL
ncbi:MAG: hypothetical protein Q9163_001673 [Psora crenata]